MTISPCHYDVSVNSTVQMSGGHFFCTKMISNRSCAIIAAVRTEVANTTGTADAMDILLNVTGHVKVHNMLHIGYV